MLNVKTAFTLANLMLVAALAFFVGLVVTATVQSSSSVTGDISERR